CQPCAVYVRTYPIGWAVSFDSSLKEIRITGLLGVPGNKTTFAYTSNLLVGITDSIGKTTTLGYDGTNHLRWIRDPGGRIDSTTIDGSGNLVTIQDWGYTRGQGGHLIQYGYDS